MTNLEQYALSVQTEKWWGYFFCRGCEACPAQIYCHAQPSGTCCRENFLQWAKTEEAEPPNEPLTLEELRGMDGEPVYIYGSGRRGYYIATDVEVGLDLYRGGFWYESYKDYGKTWLVYRRKPDGGVE